MADFDVERPYPERPKIALPAFLFALTVLTTITSGAMYEGVNPIADPAGLLKGVPFSVALIFILGTHELGHYFASRRHGVNTTLPTFIPGPPFPPMIGTFGAVIKIKSPITTKDALVDIGASGPLLGFSVALIVSAIGLEYSTVVPRAVMSGALGLGDSLIFKLLTYVVIGPILSWQDVLLHPVAFAGWIGFFVTAMNLLPVGQLDGGHVVYALIGRRHREFSIAVVAILVVLGILFWTGWFIWAALITIVGLWHPPVEDPEEPMSLRKKAVCAFTLLVFILTFIPTPFYII